MKLNIGIKIMAGIQSWIGSELDSQSGRLELSCECYDEIHKTVNILRSNSLPLLVLNPSDLEMPLLKEVAVRINKMLNEGVGFCIIDKLPLQDMTDEDAKAIYWLLSQMIGRPVAQKWSDGRMIYSVTDLGSPSGNGVRPDVTNEEQSFHTDNSYNLCPPDHVGLMCLRPAIAGGVSRVVNMLAVLERMAKEYPNLLLRLHKPYFFDRQREHAAMNISTIYKPILCEEKSGLRVRVSRNLIYQGYALRAELVDAMSEEALDAFFSIIDDPKMYKEFSFEAGQIQFLNNRLIGHKRTRFVDAPEPDLKRHLLRVWLREKGKRFYNG
jgi:alpha-ketoglutarate-dependent taurine dioxygenase